MRSYRPRKIDPDGRALHPGSARSASMAALPPTPAPLGDTFGGEADALEGSAGGGSDDIEPTGRSP
jgi:hypothetical protein